MNEIRLENYRCFHEEQIARLAPLTLLVGENSTGKTAFLAMIRILLDTYSGLRGPDFKEEPYDLGSFDEIAHHRGARGGKAETFRAGFRATPRKRQDASAENLDHHLSVTFAKKGSIPTRVKIRRALGDNWIEERIETDRSYILRIGTSRGSWEASASDMGEFDFEDSTFSFLHLKLLMSKDTKFVPLSGSTEFTAEDRKLFNDFIFPSFVLGERPFASAPVRSKPHRTYDPSRATPDSTGDYVPMYLAHVFFRKTNWIELKKRLEEFGRSAGLFDEISIRRLGKRDTEPFQLQVRKFGGHLKGPQRNLIDVGYGVSQVLPIIAELLRQDAPSMFLLQQPEVHLHPSAQAALGSLFCRVAGSGRQLVVETHSDHLMDRVRMDVRDGKTPLKPDDVSILYFERRALDVRIHSLRMDEDGNLLNAPENYHKFFMEETQRSLRL